ncbi:MAG: pectate lyase, partial [Rubrivivax sp.]|nr:pectate lyase [Pyrinomonadaceae bacterium]
MSVKSGADGKLVYRRDAQGNRVIDFSHAGYGGGGEAIPAVPVKMYVGPEGGNHRRRIQAAIDLVSAMPLDADGFRGAVLLSKGTYNIDSSLRISAGGVVLRGEGSGEDGTILVANGTSRRSLIVATGEGERAEVKGSRVAVADSYVPVGSTTLTLEKTDGLKVGDRVVVQRPSTPEWIALVGMNAFPGWRPENRLHWQPGSRDITWDRVVPAIDGTRVSIDAPITTALERKYGGGFVYRYEFRGRISQVGVENLRCVSAYDAARPADEEHAWFCITLDKVENAWVRQVTALHFVSYVVNAGADTKWLTVEDCEALDPVSELGGYRRRVFYTAGQLTLFQRCKSRRGRRDFIVGHTAAGPNVFLNCSSLESTGYSGPIESWASGVLYDNVKIRGDALRLINRDVAGQGSGWAAANSVLWNCEATDIEAQSPPGAFNQAYGSKGVAGGDGIIYDARVIPYRDFYRAVAVEPQSLYLTQLNERLGAQAVELINRQDIPASPGGARQLSDEEVAAFVKRETNRAKAETIKPLRSENGYFTIGGERAWTKRIAFTWFQAQMPRSLAPSFGPAITRFAPGRTGLGLTDNLEEVANAMPPRSVFYHHYGLWYDRRRVNHNYDGSPEQRTGEVWAPFMELPWARSGQGKAWDGLSKYDLTRFNPWFFDRVKGFADLCDERGLILYYNFYFQHWLVESRSHYVDFPWRPANTIQQTGLADEVPAANSFYDISHPVRRELHRLYIRKSLDVLKDNANVVYGIDREYTGPLAFVNFWLDTIAEWEKENEK